MQFLLATFFIEAGSIINFTILRTQINIFDGFYIKVHIIIIIIILTILLL